MGQLHVNTPKKRSVQVPPFWQGIESHSLISTEQFSPVKPKKQLQVKVELPSSQVKVPSSLHGPNGRGSQKSISVSHKIPVHPG